MGSTWLAGQPDYILLLQTVAYAVLAQLVTASGRPVFGAGVARLGQFALLAAVASGIGFVTIGLGEPALRPLAGGLMVLAYGVLLAPAPSPSSDRRGPLAAARLAVLLVAACLAVWARPAGLAVTIAALALAAGVLVAGHCGRRSEAGPWFGAALAGSAWLHGVASVVQPSGTTGALAELARATLVAAAGLALWHHVARPQLSRAARPGTSMLLLYGGLAAGWAICHLTGVETERHLRADLQRRATTAAAAIDQPLVHDLYDHDLVGATGYEHLKAALARIDSGNKDCRFAYLMTLRAGQAVFLVDSEPPGSTDYSPPGQVFEEASGPLLQALRAGTPLTEGPIADRWGVWVSSLVPVLPAAPDRPAVLLGLDIAAAEWQLVLARTRFRASLAVLLGLAFLGSLLAMQQRSREVALVHQTAQDNLRRVFDHVPEAILVHDLDGQVIDANEGMLSLYGIARSELGSLSIIRDLSAPSNPLEAVPAIWQRVVEGEPATFEWVACRPGDQRSFPAEVFLSRMELAGRAVIVATIRDITTRRAAEAELRRYADIARHAQVGVAVLSAKEDRLTLVNPAFAAMHGYTAEEMPGLPIEDVCAPDRWTALNQQLNEADRRGHRVFESIHVTRDGRRFPTLVDLTAVRDAAGRPVEYTVYVQDVTELKQAEEALRESESKYRALVEHTGDLIGRFDREGRYLYASPAFAELTAHPPEERLGHRERDLGLSPAICDQFEDCLATVFRSAQPVAMEYETHGPAGPRTFDVRFYPECDRAGQVATVLASARDITALREADRERQRLTADLQQASKLEAIGQLAGGVAHDFNNLLTTILGLGTMLAETLPEGSPEAEDIEAICQAAERAADLTRQLLAFSRRQAIEPRIIQPNRIVEGLHKMLGRLIKESIDLRIELDPDAGYVLADAGQLEQAVVNLVVNSNQAMPNGGSLTIRTGAVEVVTGLPGLEMLAPGTYSTITVADTGCGMDNETRARAFEPFFTTKGVGQGTGLGLATVYGIAHQNGGHVTCQSVLGEGTAMCVYLPEAAPVEAAATAGDEPPVRATGGRETVLVVEDEPAVRQIAERALRRQGYRVLVADEPASALACWDNGNTPIDLLLTDVVMPGMNGRELADQMRAEQPDLAVLFMSGYAESVMAREGVLPSGLEFLHKPFTSKALLLKVREVLDQAHQAAPEPLRPA